MEPTAQPSFIPHDAGTPQAARRTSAGGLWDLLVILGIVILAASCALAGGVFLYKQYLNSTKNSQLAQLKEANERFDKSLVEKLTRLDNRMDSAEMLLGTHVSPSAFFASLNQVTAKTVSYTNLDVLISDPRNIEVKMTGVARSVNSVAFQADILSKSGVFTNPIFSDLDRQRDGVHFALTMAVDASRINFENLINSAISAAAAPENTAPSSSQPASPFGGADEAPAQ
ncbi:MAG TPA: hypothetical protein VI483_00420 [Candidatus Paceibacterota bacterium]